MAVKNPEGELWFDSHKITWMDPFNHDAWRYNTLVAMQAAKLGFDEIQFDYIRFPTDGKLSMMRFAKPRTKQTAPTALIDFLRQASQVLHPLGVKISIDVFGLTTSVTSGMGIGQLMGPMTEQVDFVCPMVYPAHYAKGEYGITNPNSQYTKRSIWLCMMRSKSLDRPTLKNCAPISKTSPCLTEIRYHAKEVRAQMQAAIDLGIDSWALWNARCSYTLDAVNLW